MSDTTPTAALEKIFHEPNRLSIMSALCAAETGMSFPELKEACNLTDGNLNRHLKVLSEHSAVRIKKKFVDDRPRTTVTLTASGLARFQEYLAALEQVLVSARAALDTSTEAASTPVAAAAARKATA